MSPSPLWIFAYGSLIWRPAFRFAERRRASIEGWGRRFWQGSTDHRGVPGAPGRVVTLVPEPEEVCWGVAYRVEERDRERVLAQLDHREKGGYDRLRVETRLDPDGAQVLSLLYVANEHNANYLGPASIGAIAAQIRRCHGPSGSNVEYVLALDGALRELGIDDHNVHEVAAAIRP